MLLNISVPCRWRHKEVHDIAVECAKMSLDPIEGWSEETLGPIFNYKKSHPEKSLPPLKMHIGNHKIQSHDQISY